MYRTLTFYWNIYFKLWREEDQHFCLAVMSRACVSKHIKETASNVNEMSLDIRKYPFVMLSVYGMDTYFSFQND